MQWYPFQYEIDEKLWMFKRPINFPRLKVVSVTQYYLGDLLICKVIFWAVTIISLYLNFMDARLKFLAVSCEL